MRRAGHLPKENHWSDPEGFQPEGHEVNPNRVLSRSFSERRSDGGGFNRGRNWSHLSSVSASGTTRLMGWGFNLKAFTSPPPQKGKQINFPKAFRFLVLLHHLSALKSGFCRRVVSAASAGMETPTDLTSCWKRSSEVNASLSSSLPSAASSSSHLSERPSRIRGLSRMG